MSDYPRLLRVSIGRSPRPVPRLPRMRQQVAQLHHLVAIDDNVRVEIAGVDLVEELAAAAARRQHDAVVVDGDEGAHPRLMMLQHLGHGRMLDAKADAATKID